MRKIFYLSLGGLLCSLPLLFAEPVNEKAISILDKTDRSVDHFFRDRNLDSEGNIKLKVGGAFRHRLELRDDFNLNDATYEDDTLNLLRTRLNLTLTITPYAKLFAEGQDSESFASQAANRSANFTDRLDLHQLWGEFKSPLKKIPLAVKVGRQKLAYGDQRFVGSFEWSNTARVFDAVKLVYEPHEKIQIDAWFSQVVNVRRSKPDQATHNDNFYGLYTAIKPIKDHVIDTFLFYRNLKNDSLAGEKAGHFGDEDRWTFGNRFKGETAGFDYGLEWALQTGNRASETIEAWAMHNLLGYTAAALPWSPRFSAEFNHASGDSNPRDGRFETFDNLYPANHNFYGYIDFISLKNTENVKLGFDLKPHPKVKLLNAYHWFFLNTSGSPVFNAGQAAIRPANADASRAVGQELDLLIQWNVSKHLDFQIGYSHFFAGPWFEDTGAQDDANFFYIQNGVTF